MTTKKTKTSPASRKLPWLILAVVSGLLALGFAFNALFLSYTLASGRGTLALQPLLITSLLLPATYYLYWSSKQRYLSSPSQKTVSFKSFIKTHSVVGLILVVAVVTLLTHIVDSQTNNHGLNTDKSSSSTHSKWQKFLKDTESVTYHDAVPVFEGHYTQGCFKDSEVPAKSGCIFNNAEFYVFPGDYTANTRKILSYMLDHGHEFPRNEGTPKDIDDYTDPASLSKELKEQGFIHISLKTDKPNTTSSLTVGDKRLMVSEDLYKIPPEKAGSVTDTDMVYVISERKTLDW